MGFKYDFDIIEQPDARSFIIKDLTGLYDAETNIGGWGSPNFNPAPEGAYYTIIITFKKYINVFSDETEELEEFSFTTEQYSISDMLTNGVELYKSDSTIFEDAAYKVNVQIILNNNGSKIVDTTKDFGFYALTKATCMNDFITYNPFLPRKDKEIFWEKSRLLDNLYYACETDQILHFRENLESLNRLK